MHAPCSTKNRTIAKLLQLAAQCNGVLKNTKNQQFVIIISTSTKKSKQNVIQLSEQLQAKRIFFNRRRRQRKASMEAGLENNKYTVERKNQYGKRQWVFSLSNYSFRLAISIWTFNSLGFLQFRKFIFFVLFFIYLKSPRIKRYLMTPNL